jgi:hypothetical protein
MTAIFIAAPVADEWVGDPVAHEGFGDVLAAESLCPSRRESRHGRSPCGRVCCTVVALGRRVERLPGRLALTALLLTCTPVSASAARMDSNV